MLVEKSIQIIGGKKLTGTIEVSGAKNAVLKQMILPILSEGIYKINNVPNIADDYYMQEVLDVLGIKSKLDKKTLEINSPSDISVEAPYEVVQKMRASIIVLGPLLARKGEVKIAFPTVNLDFAQDGVSQLLCQIMGGQLDIGIIEK